MDVVSKLRSLISTALSMEYAAEIQYYTHAEVLRGTDTPTTSALLIDSAGDESKHAAILRDILASHLDYMPPMSVAETHAATDTQKIIKRNILDERAAIDQYEKIMKFLEENKNQIDAYYLIWTKIKSILVEEYEHRAELEVLNG